MLGWFIAADMTAGFGKLIKRTFSWFIPKRGEVRRTINQLIACNRPQYYFMIVFSIVMCVTMFIVNPFFGIGSTLATIYVFSRAALYR